MKKILFFSLIFLGANLFASCVNWYNNPSYQQPPKPYCFNAELTHFVDKAYNEKEEDVSDLTSTAYDYYGADFRGDGTIGFYVYISQWGYGSSTSPIIKMNYITADLVGKSTFYNSSNIVLGYVYLFYVTQEVSDVKGTLKLYNYASLKDTLYIK